MQRAIPSCHGSQTFPSLTLRREILHVGTFQCPSSGLLAVTRNWTPSLQQEVAAPITSQNHSATLLIIFILVSSLHVSPVLGALTMWIHAHFWQPQDCFGALIGPLLDRVVDEHTFDTPQSCWQLGELPNNSSCKLSEAAGSPMNTLLQCRYFLSNLMTV